jgi:hypothetical protein
MQPAKRAPAPLQEGVDYTMEAGKLVFTAAYHLKRGYCCNSKCRHCPYGADGRPASVVTIDLVPGRPTRLP